MIAAVDNSAAAMPVLSTAAAAARLFHAELEAIHVEEATRPVAAQEAANAARARLLLVKGPTVAAAVRRVALQKDVVAVVLGARSRPSGRRPAGHVAVKVATSVPKPIVVVPPDCALPVHFRRVLIPLERDMVTASALRETIEALKGARAEIVLLHIFEERDLPLVTDQPQHETDAWISEFLRRYCPDIDIRRVELRAGVPAEHLLTVAGEIGADALVLGWGQRLEPGRAVLVRTALEHSRIPVILVPVQRRSAGSAAGDRNMIGVSP